MFSSPVGRVLCGIMLSAAICQETAPCTLAFWRTAPHSISQFFRSLFFQPTMSPMASMGTHSILAKSVATAPSLVQRLVAYTLPHWQRFSHLAKPTMVIIGIGTLLWFLKNKFWNNDQAGMREVHGAEENGRNAIPQPVSNRKQQPENLAQIQAELTRAQQRIQELNQQMNVLQRAHEQAQNTQASAQQEVLALTQQLAQRIQENKQSQEAVEQAQAEAHAHEKLNQELQNRAQTLAQDLAQTKKQVEEREQTLSQSQQDLEQIKKAVERAQTEAQTREQQIGEFRHNLELARQQLARANQEKEAAAQQARAGREGLKKTLAQMNNLFEQQLSALEQQIRSQVEKCEQDFTRVHQKSEEALSQTKKQIEKYKQALAKARQEKEAAIQQVQQEIDSVTQYIRSKIGAVPEENDNPRYSSLLHMKQEGAAQEKLGEAQKIVPILQTTLDELQHADANKDKELERTRQELEQTKKQVEELQHTLTKVKKIVGPMGAQVAAYFAKHPGTRRLPVANLPAALPAAVSAAAQFAPH